MTVEELRQLYYGDDDGIDNGDDDDDEDDEVDVLTSYFDREAAGTLHYTTLHYTTLHYTTLHYTTLHYTTPYEIHIDYTLFFKLYPTRLHSTTLHYTTLHYTKGAGGRGRTTADLEYMPSDDGDMS